MWRNQRSFSAGWPDEFEKNRPKCSPIHFIGQNEYIPKYYHGKKGHTNMGSFCNLQKNCPETAMAQWAKIRPIWSSWFSVTFFAAGTICLARNKKADLFAAERRMDCMYTQCEQKRRSRLQLHLQCMYVFKCLVFCQLFLFVHSSKE
jgi:hypothetical protein